MKKIKVLILLFAVMLTIAFMSVQTFAATGQVSKSVSIIFTSDMHSHMQSNNGSGGLAKIKTLVNKIKEKYPDSLLLDGGDFSMGTPYQTIFMSDASELGIMGKLGYDVTTLGNHEFDYKPQGLANMFKNASRYKTSQHMPYVVNSNINWRKTLTSSKLSKNAGTLKNAMDNYGVRDYVIIKKNGVRIAVFGLMGHEAVADAPESGLDWTDYITSAKATVKKIKDSGKADMIVCLSHSGIYKSQGNNAEDIQLAKAVPDIDVILSGHSHESMDKALAEGNTTIVSCGCFTKYLGHVVLKKSGDRYKAVSYDLLGVNKSVKEDSTMKTYIDSFQTKINSDYFSKFGYTTDKILTYNKYKFPDIDYVDKVIGEDTLGNLMADSYIYAVDKYGDNVTDPINVAVIPSGVIRGSFDTGAITVADAFNSASLGIGPDNIPGYPLVSVYATGREIKLLAEVDVSLSSYLSGTKLFFSGLKYKYNTNRLILNKTYDLRIKNNQGKYVKIDNKKLYHVVVDLYSCQMIGAIKDRSMGLLSFVPKDKNGNVIKDLNDAVITGKNGEVKMWYAVASYLDSFKGKQVPVRYSTAEGRKVNETSWNPVSIIKQPNRVAAVAIAAVLVLILIIMGIVKFIKKIRRRRCARL